MHNDDVRCDPRGLYLQTHNRISAWIEKNIAVRPWIGTVRWGGKNSPFSGVGKHYSTVASALLSPRNLNCGLNRTYLARNWRADATRLPDRR
jgi:hypothetical protein